MVLLGAHSSLSDIPSLQRPFRSSISPYHPSILSMLSIIMMPVRSSECFPFNSVQFIDAAMHSVSLHSNNDNIFCLLAVYEPTKLVAILTKHCLSHYQGL